LKAALVVGGKASSGVLSKERLPLFVLLCLVTSEGGEEWNVRRSLRPLPFANEKVAVAAFKTLDCGRLQSSLCGHLQK
jgi:hypothetical protein